MLTRRKFLKTIGSAITVTTSPLLLKGCAAGFPTYRGEFNGETITIPKTEAMALTAPNGVMMVRASNLPMPIVLRNLEGKGLIALSTICTHAGCEVRVLPNAFECPCHGSAYAADGIVEDGPAPRPLQRFAVIDTPEQIIIRVKS
jgi:cytochrome b6-f complex iron-sulfur subunit